MENDCYSSSICSSGLILLITSVFSMSAADEDMGKYGSHCVVCTADTHLNVVPVEYS